MSVSFLSKLRGSNFNGPSHSVPEQVRAQAEIDSVFWYNTGPGMESWKALPYYHDLSEYPSQFIHDLPEPFNRPDVMVVEFNYLLHESRIGLELLAGDIPYIVVPRGTLTKQMWERASTKMKREYALYHQAFIRNAAALQYLTGQEYLQSEDSWNEKYAIIPNGIAMPEKRKSGFNKDRIQCAYIGRLDALQKGLDLLLDACSQISGDLKMANCSIILCGPDSYSTLQALKEQAARLGLEGIVEFRGGVYGEEKERLLLASDVFLMPSRFEGQPMALLEALAYGLPCVAATGTNMRDVIDAYHAGWTADCASEDIARALESMLREKDKLTDYSANARRLAQEYDWHVIAQKQHAFYEEIANGRYTGPG